MPKKDQGILKGRYQIIPRTLIFIFRDNELLLLKGASTKRLWANLYNGIGGHIEKGEDVISAARRELFEETGLQIDDLRLCGTVMVDAEQEVGIGIYVIKGDYKDGEIRELKEGKLDWVRIDEISQIPIVEDLLILLPRIVASSKEDSPFSARYFYDEADRLQIRFA